jgi:hypothetical protein
VDRYAMVPGMREGHRDAVAIPPALTTGALVWFVASRVRTAISANKTPGV